MATVYTPDNCTEYIKEPDGRLTVFLAGTIDNGSSIDWQQELIKKLEDRNDIVLYNPRKASWDPNAGPDAVEKQILWELEMQDKVDIVVMNIIPGSKSPICLLELGLHLGKEKPLMLLCSEGFYRWTNVRVTARRYLPQEINIWDNSKPDYLDKLAYDLRGIADHINRALTDPQYMEELNELFMKTWSKDLNQDTIINMVLLDKVVDKEFEAFQAEAKGFKEPCPPSDSIYFPKKES